MRRALALLAVAAALCSGCSYVPTTSMAYAPEGAVRQPVPATLAVVPLTEGRPDRYYPSLLGRAFLTYVPLIPYVEVPYERLDESLAVAARDRGETLPPGQMFPDKMALAIADDLERSGLFSKVTFVPEGTPDADYTLHGTLRSTELDVNMTSYMLGMPGVLLWLLPIPNGSTTVDVVIDLELHDRAGQTVWTFPLKGDSRKVFMMYTSSGAAISNRLTLEIPKYGDNDKGIDPRSLWAYHADALRGGMGAAKVSLAQYLASPGR